MLYGPTQKCAVSLATQIRTVANEFRPLWLQKYDCFICIYFYSFITFAITQKRFVVESLYINNLFFFSISHSSSKKSLISFPESTQKNILLLNFLHMNPLKLLILLTSFVSIESRVCFVFHNSSTGKIRTISDSSCYFLVTLVLSRSLLIVLRSMTMISGLFLKWEVFILCVLTSTVLYQK